MVDINQNSKSNKMSADGKDEAVSDANEKSDKKSLSSGANDNAKSDSFDKSKSLEGSQSDLFISQLDCSKNV